MKADDSWWWGDQEAESVMWSDVLSWIRRLMLMQMFCFGFFFHFNLNNFTPPPISVQTLQLRQDLSAGWKQTQLNQLVGCEMRDSASCGRSSSSLLLSLRLCSTLSWSYSEAGEDLRQRGGPQLGPRTCGAASRLHSELHRLLLDREPISHEWVTQTNFHLEL